MHFFEWNFTKNFIFLLKCLEAKILIEFLGNLNFSYFFHFKKKIMGGEV